MRADAPLLGLHASGVALALTAALLWPRPGQAALMVPLGSGDMRSAIDWAMREDAALLALDTTRGRVIARVTDNRSLLHALERGILPVAARAPDCRTDKREASR
ncbi:MAG: hypothetical protein ACOVQY_12940 [Erythrobacter sp.]|jgi:hypothetical protein